MDPLSLYHLYYEENSDLWNTLYTHSRMVADKALYAAETYLKKHKNAVIDLEFIEIGSMLHDIGIFKTHFPSLGLFGDAPYLMHGIYGRELLESHGLPPLALVCERHVGVGITAEEIRQNHLPLPERDMVPISIEEQIICYADKFYSKDPGRLKTEKTATLIASKLLRFGKDKSDTFLKWHSMFS